MINNWCGLGRLVRDPEIKYSNDNKPIARYTLAVSRTFKREGEPDADFIPCVAFGKNAEFTEKYLRKGTGICVVGRIQTGSYTNKDGQKVYTTDVIVEQQSFSGSKNSNSEGTVNAKGDSSDFIAIPDGIDDELPFA